MSWVGQRVSLRRRGWTLHARVTVASRGRDAWMRLSLGRDRKTWLACRQFPLQLQLAGHLPFLDLLAPSRWLLELHLLFLFVSFLPAVPRDNAHPYYG